MRTTMSVVLAALVLAGFVAGCSDDESADATTTTAESDGGDTTTTAAEDDSTTSEPSSGGGVGGFSTEECRQLADAFDQADLGNSVASGDDPTPELEASAQQLSDAAGKAPDEVRGDIETLADFYERLAAASGDVDWDGIQSGNPAAIAGAAQFAQEFASQPDVVTASQNLATWAAENCAPTG